MKWFCEWQVVNRYIDEGVAELVPGVLFIDEVFFSFNPFSSLDYLQIAFVYLGFLNLFS